MLTLHDVSEDMVEIIGKQKNNKLIRNLSSLDVIFNEAKQEQDNLKISKLDQVLE